MTNDLKRARRAQAAASRRTARAAYVNAFSWDIRVTWPRGFWAAAWMITLMLTPVGLLALFALIGSRRRPTEEQPRGAA